MLTAEHVHVRKRSGVLTVVPLDGELRVRAIALAQAFLELAQAHVGRTRRELDDAWDAVDDIDRRLCAGLRKLTDDLCEFFAEPDCEPQELRSELFLAANAARQALADGEYFDRGAVLGRVAEARGLTPERVEALLFSDLRDAHVLRAVRPASAEGLVDAYDAGQAQAVLLRAVRVRVRVQCATAGAYRALFRRLKFLRLLYALSAEGGGYRIDIDGPCSMFDASTQYGLRLALVLPVLANADAYDLEADVRWGKTREALLFRHKRAHSAMGSVDDALPDEVAALLRALKAQETPWKVARASELLELPGVGVVVPDLVFRREGRKRPVFLEVLGFWSRDAVWRRVELVQAGLAARVLFAASERLRVSEQVLGPDVPGALYVYKGVMSARSVLERVERLDRIP